MPSRTFAALLFLLIASPLLAQNASISVDVILVNSPIVAGTNVDYTIGVSNEGPANADNVQLTMDVPPGTTFVSLNVPAGWTCPSPPVVGGTGTLICSHPSFPPGSDVFTLTTALPASTPRDTIITETSSLTTTTADPDPGDQLDSVSAAVVWQSTLAIAKSTPAIETAGNTLTYTISITNSGPSQAGDLVLDDVLPPPLTFQSITAPGWSCTTPAVDANGTVNCTLAEAPIGAFAAITLVTRIPSSASGQVTNTVDLSSSTDPNGTRTSNATTTFVASADLSLAKTSQPTVPVIGQDIVYTIAVTNAGPSDAQNVTVTDALPPPLTFQSISASGWSCITPPIGTNGTVTCSRATMTPSASNIVITARVSPSVTPGTTITNSATATSSTSDPSTPNSSSASGAAIAAFTATKAATGPFIVGQPITYTIVIRNNGTTVQGDNPGDEFVDVLPASLTLISATATSGATVADVPNRTVHWNGSLAPGGGTVTITINARINGGTGGTQISNQGTANVDLDGNGTNETPLLTSDTTTGGPTVFAAVALDEVPTLSVAMLFVFAIALGLLALVKQ